jgi:hypothetical protein
MIYNNCFVFLTITSKIHLENILVYLAISFCILCVHADVYDASDLDLTSYHGRLETCPETFVLENSACVCEVGRQLVGDLCNLCPFGTYKDFVGAGPCTTCPNEHVKISLSGSTTVEACLCVSGYTVDPQDETACVGCAIGTYKPYAGQGACLQCPNNTNTVGGQQNTLDACLCNAGYTGENGGPCLSCTAGKYKTTSGSMACEECGVHFNSPEASTLKTDCICNAGYQGNDGSDECVACGHGKYKLNPGDANCADCPQNSFHTLTASASLTDCQCNAGYTGQDGTFCTACLPGTYKSQIGSDDCKNCVADTFSASSAQVLCTPCTENSLSTETGNDESTDCLCNAGYTAAPAQTSLQCMSCAPGSFKVGNSNEACNLCPHGEYQSLSTQTSCETCSENSHSHAEGSDAITDCVCNAGYTGADGSLCVNCEAGYHKSTTGSVACTACGKDTFSTVVASVTSQDCQSCAQFMSTNGLTGQTECDCIPGYFQKDGICEECEAGSYCPGHSPKIACFGNSNSPLQSSSVDACQCIPGYYEPVDQTCTECPPNSFCLGGETKIDCPEHSTSPKGSISTDDCICVPGFKDEE